MPAKTAIDVVIPCYKYAEYLRGCVQSVLEQDGVDVRVLIIDDCSPDHTPAIAAELAAQDSRVEYRRHAVNLRHIDTYNEGLLEWASAELSLLLSADDLLAPGALRRAAEVFSTYPNVGFVHGRQLVFEDVPPTAPASDGAAAVMVQSGMDFLHSCCEVAGNPVATPTAVVKTSLQKKIGGYRKHLPHSADMEMWLRFAACASVARVDAVQALKRAHQANMQIQYLRSPLGDWKEREETFASFFESEGRFLNPEFRELAQKRLAMQAFWTASKALDEGDRVTYMKCFNHALRLCPDLKKSRECSRLQWKRRLGRGWKLVRPIVNWLRRRCAA